MDLHTIPYTNYEASLPQTGKHILAQQKTHSLLVYQAYHPEIAAYTVAQQELSGPHFKYSRMSWIKPNFLWMMYRCGWAQKENQERVLALELSKKHFSTILEKAVPSSYDPRLFPDRTDWKAALASSEVRLQWDPDHTPNGAKLQRKAIQLGLKGQSLWDFGKHGLISVTDITDFVREQHRHLQQKNSDFIVPQESVFPITDPQLRRSLQMED